MRWRFSILFYFLLLICACEADPAPPVPEENYRNPQPHENYLKFTINDNSSVIFYIPHKADLPRNLGAEEQEWAFSLGPKKYTLKFWAVRYGKYGQEVEKISGFIKDYQGPGRYVLEENINSCQYFIHGIFFSSAIPKAEDYIHVTEDLGDQITGAFRYTSYNLNDNNDSRLITGEFRLEKVMLDQ